MPTSRAFSIVSLSMAQSMASPSWCKVVPERFVCFKLALSKTICW
jgi:hypothetical protein